MAEEYCGGANWWDSSPNNNRSSSTTTTRFDGVSGGGGGGSSTSSTTTLANSTSGAGAGYGWLTETSAVDTKLDASSLQLMGLGLSNSPTMEWNQQHILRNPEKTDNSFRSMLQEGMGLGSSFQQEATGAGAGAGAGAGGVLFSNSQLQWRPEKLFPSNEDSPELKQIGRGFSLDQQQQQQQQQPQFSPSCSSMESSITCNNNQGFQLDSSSSSSVYGSPSSILQGLMGHDQQNNHQHQQQLGYGATNNNSGNYQQNYFGMPQFLRASSPKQQQQQQQQQLQFMNNAPYWNASASAVSMNDVRPNFFSSLQAPPQLSMPSFEEKPKLQATMEMRDTNSMVKKSNTSQENNTKRARNDAATSTLPPFKVRKEKMGDRITALQQLVSPFGKTDTASVLSEAIEYIKFLHEQVLSNPYLKSGAPYQQQQPSNEKTKVDPDGPKQDLRSRGLCLVPVSSTFPVTHETTVDFWTPTFGGTFR